MFRAYHRFCRPAPLLLMHGKNRCNKLLDMSISNECGLLQTWRSQLGGFVNKKRGSARDHERDIVKYRPYSSFVDKWIFMLINWDSNMSENCGECGIALSIRPYTGINVASSVCGLSLSYRIFFFFCRLGFYIQFGTTFTADATDVHHAWSHMLHFHSNCTISS